MKSICWILSISVVLAFSSGCDGDDCTNPTNPGNSTYDVDIDPVNFLPGDSIAGNAYFPLVVNRIMIFEGSEEGEAIRVEERVTDSLKVIQGITCRVVSAREYENGSLIEDTYDWYAQDRDGNVWYFGEDTHEIENGVPVSSAGSWESGVDGALGGILMLAHPIAGMWYRQEFYEGEAEDVAQVLGIGESLTVPYGTFANCLRTLEYSPLEPGVEENKIYAPGVGILRAVGTRGGSGFEDLISVIEP